MKKTAAKGLLKRLAPGIGAVAALGLGYLGGLAHQPPPRTIEVVKTVKVPVEVIKTVPAAALPVAPAPAVEPPKKKKAATKRKAEAPAKKWYQF